MEVFPAPCAVSVTWRTGPLSKRVWRSAAPMTAPSKSSKSRGGFCNSMVEKLGGALPWMVIAKRCGDS